MLSESPENRAGRGLNLSSRNIAQAVRGALAITMRQRVADGSIATLRQFIEEQERLQDEFKQLLEPLEGGPQR